MSFYHLGPIPLNNNIFQGRQREINDLIESCQRQYVEGYWLIYGSRQSGKTSLLMRLAERINSFATPVHISFRAHKNADKDQVADFLAKEIYLAVQGGKLSDGRKFASTSTLPDVTYSEFERWLRTLSLQSKLLVLLEEVGSLPLETRRSLGNLFRKIYDTRTGRPAEHIMLLFWGGIELLEFSKVDVSPLADVCQECDLQDLTQVDTRELLRNGLPAEFQNSIDIEAWIKEIYYHAKGHPFLTQKICGLMLENLHEGNLICQHKSFQKQVDHMLEESHFFSHLCDTVSSYGLDTACWNLIGHRPGSSTIPCDKDEFRKLQLIGAASLEKNTYQIRNPMLQRSLKKWYQETPSIPPSYWQPNDRREPEHLLLENPPIREKELTDLKNDLIKHQSLKTSRDIEGLLSRTGMSDLMRSFDIHGTPNNVIPMLVDHLMELGRFEDGNHPLGIILHDLQEFSGYATKVELDKIITKYGLILEKEKLSLKD